MACTINSRILYIIIIWLYDRKKKLLTNLIVNIITLYGKVFRNSNNIPGKVKHYIPMGTQSGIIN